MECKGCMWMLGCVVAPLALFAACGVLALRACAQRTLARRLPRADEFAGRELGAEARTVRALETVVRVQGADV